MWLWTHWHVASTLPWAGCKLYVLPVVRIIGARLGLPIDLSRQLTTWTLAIHLRTAKLNRQLQQTQFIGSKSQEKNRFARALSPSHSLRAYKMNIEAQFRFNFAQWLPSHPHEYLQKIKALYLNYLRSVFFWRTFSATNKRICALVFSPFCWQPMSAKCHVMAVRLNAYKWFFSRTLPFFASVPIAENWNEQCCPLMCAFHFFMMRHGSTFQWRSCDFMIFWYGWLGCGFFR